MEQLCVRVLSPQDSALLSSQIFKNLQNSPPVTGKDNSGSGGWKCHFISFQLHASSLSTPVSSLKSVRSQ